MKKTLIFIILLLILPSLNAIELFESQIDSIAVIGNLDITADIKFNRQNFVREQMRLSLQNKLPIFILNNPTEIQSLIEILSTDSIECTLSVPTNTQLLSIQRNETGEYDFKRGFIDDNELNIKACVVVFTKNSSEIIWIGEDNMDRGYDRYRKHGLFDLIKHYIDEIFIVN